MLMSWLTYISEFEGKYIFRVLSPNQPYQELNADVWLRFWRWNLVEICVRTCYFDQNWTLGSVVPLAMFFKSPSHRYTNAKCKLSHAERAKAPLVWMQKSCHSFVCSSVHVFLRQVFIISSIRCFFSSKWGAGYVRSLLGRNGCKSSKGKW